MLVRWRYFAINTLNFECSSVLKEKRLCRLTEQQKSQTRWDVFRATLDPPHTESVRVFLVNDVMTILFTKKRCRALCLG